MPSARQVTARFAAAAAGVVPPRLGYLLAGLVGDVLSVAARPMIRTYEANVVQALGGEPLKLHAMRRSALRNLAWNYWELFRLAHMDRDELRACGSLSGLEPALESVAASGSTGALIAFGHVGNIELVSHVGVLLPHHRFAVVVERMTDTGLGELLTGMRRCHGLDVIPADEPRRVLRALASGVHVIVACDYDSTGSGVVVELLGRPARMPVGAVRLALSTGAPLFLVTTSRDSSRDPGHYRGSITGPIRLRRSQDRSGDIRWGVAHLAALHGRHVREHPDQWLAFRPVWEVP